MSPIFMQFPSALVGALAVMIVLAHAQDQLDFISIDCGLQQNSDYTQSTTTIRYTPDTDYIDTGEGKSVSRQYNPEQQFWFVRVFPEGTRNCYKINIKSGQKYLLRASFGYGNYDGEKNLPEFELHLGPNLWDSVVFTQVNETIIKELIHVPVRNYIHVCLVNINKGVPFISTIELRRFRNDAYQTEAGSLALMKRINIAKNDTEYRYPNDVNDRIWTHEFGENWSELSASAPIDPDQTDYELPSDVMSTAATPQSTASYLNISWAPGVVDKNASYYIYMHFAEVEEVTTSRSRELNVTINGELIDKPFDPVYLKTTTKNTTIAADVGAYYFSIYSPDPIYKPILNAYEIYMKKEFLVSETNQQDVEAITNLKSTYKIVKNWQGDPCNPQVYLWEGVICSYSHNDSSRIVSLDLSSSRLTGQIADSIANLTMIHTLDLSDNKLSGQIPEYLSQLSKLKILNLEKNELTGSVPAGLIAKRNDGLSLSLCGNPSLTGQVPCEKKKNQFVIPVVVSIIVMLLVSSIAAAILWNSKRFRAHLKYWRVGEAGAITESEIHNRKGHDVFLSFRGEDTRTGFARYLYEALEKEGIKTFFDDKKLKKGDEIAVTLVEAIEASEISIILFSENYVSSSWCLGELLQILECRNTKDQRVIPVFYRVDPSHVRHQTDSFSLNKWIDKGHVNVSVWEKALTEVASLVGFHYKDGYEFETINKIVKETSDAKEQKKEKSLERFVSIRPPDGNDKIVIYMTSSAKDKNFQNCQLMLQSLSQFDQKLWQQRDVSKKNFRQELKMMMKKELPPPRMFVKGKYVGGYDEVSKLIKEEPWFCETLRKFPNIDERSLHGQDVVQQEEAGAVISVSEREIDGRGGSPV